MKKKVVGLLIISTAIFILDFIVLGVWMKKNRIPNLCMKRYAHSCNLQSVFSFIARKKSKILIAISFICNNYNICSSFPLQFGVGVAIQIQRKRGVVSSAVIFLYWLLLVIVTIIPIQTAISFNVSDVY